MVSIPEMVFLFSLHEKRNGSIQINKSPYLSFGLIAAGLIQIIMDNVGVLNSAKKIVITNPSEEMALIPTDLVKIIVYEKEYKKSSFWIQALGHKRKRIQEDFLARFTDRELLIPDGQLFRFNPAIIPAVKFLEKEELRKQVFYDKPLCIEMYAVIELMETIHLLDLLFTSDEIKPVHYRIDNLLQIEASNEEDKMRNSNVIAILDALDHVISNELD